MDGVNSCVPSVIDSVSVLWCRIQTSGSADKALRQAAMCIRVRAAREGREGGFAVLKASD